jgi:hypothetical protein
MNLFIGLFCLAISAGLLYQLGTYHTLRAGAKRHAHWVAIILNVGVGVANLIVYSYGLARP